MYRIMEGVRRAVATRDAGRDDVPAFLEVLGQPDTLIRVPLDELYTNKDTLPRDSRYIKDVEYPTVVLGREVPPLSVCRISPRTAARLTPIRAVRLV